MALFWFLLTIVFCMIASWATRFIMRRRELRMINRLREQQHALLEASERSRELQRRLKDIL